MSRTFFISFITTQFICDPHAGSLFLVLVRIILKTFSNRSSLLRSSKTIFCYTFHFQPTCVYFLHLIISTYFQLSSTPLPKKSCSLFSELAIITVSATYLILLRLRPPIINPVRFSRSVTLASMQKLNNSGDKAHSGLTLFPIFVLLLNSESAYMQAICVQCQCWIIPISFPCRSDLTNISKTYSYKFPNVIL